VVYKNGYLQDLNQAALHLPGADALRIGERLPAENPITDHLRVLLHTEKDNIEFSIVDAADEIRYYNAKAYPLINKLAQVDGLAILINDVTETAGLMRQLSQQANTDALTGLFNRRQLMQLGMREVENSRLFARPLGVILIDLDNFKSFNDRFGHAAGDEILKKVANNFRKGLRNIDILGRYGGEEFAIFLPAADMHSTAQVAERLRQHLMALPMVIEGKSESISASFGVHSAVAASQTTIEDWLKIADLALYQAKNNGRNQVACSSWQEGKAPEADAKR